MSNLIVFEVDVDPAEIAFDIDSEDSIVSLAEGDPTIEIGATPGDRGAQGIQGETGIRGSQWFSGEGAPGDLEDALAGDIYIDTLTGQIYELD